MVAMLFAACSHPAPVATTTTTTTTTSDVVANGGHIHRFKIGALDAFALKDGELRPSNDGKLFLYESPRGVAEVLAAAGAPTDYLELGLQPLLVVDGAKILLFDTGLGTANRDQQGTLLRSLALTRFSPSSITDIFISHSHGDHVGGLVDAAHALVFPNATIHISSPEWVAMRANTKLAALVTAITAKVVPFEPGAQLLREVTAVSTIGHTPGHSSFDIASNGDHLFYLGDVAHSWIVSVQVPAWQIESDAAPLAASVMREHTFDRLAADHTHVYAVHFPFPGLGHVVANRRWAPDDPEPTPPDAMGECVFASIVRCVARHDACAPMISRGHPDGGIRDPNDHLSPAQTASHPGQCCYVEFRTTACD